MEQQAVKKIVVIGPESTGKSTLCELLAQQYQTQWCPEFAREYLLTNGKEYEFDDLEIIAKGNWPWKMNMWKWLTASYQPPAPNCSLLTPICM